MQCREFAPVEDSEAGKNGKVAPEDRLKELASNLESSRSEVAAWCRASYGEAFTAWVHICAVRLFVESVLRYGLPPKFLGAIVEPHEGRGEVKLRKTLASEFGSHGAEFWTNDEDAPGDAKDVHPYVSFTLDIDS